MAILLTPWRCHSGTVAKYLVGNGESGTFSLRSGEIAWDYGILPIVNAFRGVHAVMSPESGRWCTMKAQRAWMVHHLPDEGDITCMYTEKCIDNDFVTFKLDLPVHSGTSPPFWMTSLPLANELLPKQSCDQNKNMCFKMVVMYNCVRGVHQYL